jgi:hypothetical protein
MGMHLNRTALFSLRAAEMNTKYLLVKGLKGSLWMEFPRYLFAW